MSKFGLYLNEKNIELEGEEFALGTIIIGHFKETFHASLSYWSKDKYYAQWKSALERLIEGKSACLVTSIYDPKETDYIFWWVLFLVEDTIYIQDHILLMNDLSSPFNESNLYDFIPNRETVNEDGESISEWKIKLSSIQNFLDNTFT